MIAIKVKFKKSTRKNQKGTIYYQLVCKRVCECIATNYEVYPHEWNLEYSLVVVANAEYQRRQELRLIEKAIIRDVAHLQNLIAEECDLNQVLFDFCKMKDENFLFVYGERIADELKNEGRIKTSRSYRTALNSFLKFHGSNAITFDELTPRLIKEYEKYLQEKGICNNSISFYMRNLRAIYNRAVNENYTDQNLPFKGVYVGIDKTAKRAVDEQVISKLKSLELSDKPWLEFARDIFMFSFYARGMAFVDVAHLTKKNVQGDYIIYQRQKTGQELNIRIEPCLKIIIKRYSSQACGEFLLPILEREGLNYDSALRLYNMRLDKISKIIRLDSPLTSYIARHSWATLAKKKGVPTSIISEGMGHNNEKTTQIYLSSLDKSIIDTMNSKLLADI